MIRLIQRRLIIPRGDTGTFSVPLMPGAANTSTAVLFIYDPIFKKTMQAIQGVITDDTITFTFTREHTINLETKKYLWDIILYTNPQYDEKDEEHIQPINGDYIDSYYAAFSLPVCEIKEAAQNV